MTRNAAYDSRGNITAIGGLSFEYDMADQPRTVSGTNRTGGAVSGGTYVYDGNLKRVKSVINGVTRYNVYDKDGKLAHVEEGDDNYTSETDYLHAAGMPLARIKDGVYTYMHPDHLGSASAGTNEDGSLAFTEYHTPFGEVLTGAAANDNQSDFTGHIRDKDIGMSYMQARYYDPNFGRFLSIDPVTFMDTGDPEMFNRYSYVGNNPVNYIDPFGLEKRELERVVTGSRIPKKITVEAGNLTQKQVDKLGDQLPNEAFTQLNGQDLSSFAAFTYKDNADEEVTHTSSDLLDEFNIAHQIGMGLAPPSNEFPAVNGVSYDSKDQVYGRAITAGTNRMPITSFGRGSLYTSLGERINTFQN